MPIKFKGTHPNFPSDTTWDSWEEAVEATLEIAENVAKEILREDLMARFSEIADIMIDTVEEFEVTEPDVD